MGQVGGPNLSLIEIEFQFHILRLGIRLSIGRFAKAPRGEGIDEIAVLVA